MIAVLVIAGLTFATLALQSTASPEQRVADAAPPADPEVTAVVEMRLLEESLTVPGTVVSRRSISVPVPEVPEDLVPIVTRAAPAVGQVVKAGSVLAEVSDRPVVLLQGDVPLYRDAHLGDEGADVESFQQALSSLGYRVTVDGELGPATATAARRLWRDLDLRPADLAEAAPDRVAGPQATAGEPDQAGVTTAPAGSTDDLPTTRTPAKRFVLPRSLFAFIPTETVTIEQSPYARGEPATDDRPLAVLATNESRLRLLATAAQASMLSAGLSVSSSLPDGRGIEGRIVEIGTPDERGQVPVTAEILGEQGPAPGTAVNATVTIKSSQTPVPAVPVAAVRTDESGATFVYAVNSVGARTRVDVPPVPAIGGWVAVADTALREGQAVAIG